MIRTPIATAYFPGLDKLMRAKQATNEALAERSGVSVRTINYIRLGKPVQPKFIEYIKDTLEKYEFKYKKTGPKAGIRRQITPNN